MINKPYEARYLKLLKKVEEGNVFKRDKVVRWKCRNCGYIHEGKTPPGKFPACEHPESYFEVLEVEE